MCVAFRLLHDFGSLKPGDGVILNAANSTSEPASSSSAAASSCAQLPSCATPETRRTWTSWCPGSSPWAPLRRVLAVVLWRLSRPHLSHAAGADGRGQHQSPAGGEQVLCQASAGAGCCWRPFRRGIGGCAAGRLPARHVRVADVCAARAAPDARLAQLWLHVRQGAGVQLDAVGAQGPASAWLQPAQVDDRAKGHQQ